MDDRIPVIVDVDTGCDDTIALLVLGKSEKINLLAAVSTFGNSTTENTTRNTCNVLHMMGRSDVPVGRGQDNPWKKKLHTSPYIHGFNGVGEYVFPENHYELLSGEYAWDLSYRRMKEYGDKVVYVALGSLTNLGNMLKKYPDSRDMIEKVIYMGGEPRSNCAGSQTASVNIFHDPDAAAYVIAQNLPFYMCSGTGVTCHVGFSLKEINELLPTDSVYDTAIRTMIRSYFAACGAFGESDRTSFIHDASTVMILLKPECYKATPYHCDVEVEGTETYGYSQIDFYHIGHTPEEDNIFFVEFDDTKEKEIHDEILRIIGNR